MTLYPGNGGRFSCDNGRRVKGIVKGDELMTCWKTSPIGGHPGCHRDLAAAPAHGR